MVIGLSISSGNSIPHPAGEGMILAISDSAQAPSYPCVTSMNFSAEQLKPLSTLLNWAHVDEDWAPGDFLNPNSEN